MTTFRQTNQWPRTGLLLLAVGTLLLWPVAGFALEACPDTAETICTNGLPEEDCDHDGFTNAMECNGFPTVGATSLDIYGYLTSDNAAQGDIILNPAEPDLMFIAQYAVDDNNVQSELMYDALRSASDEGKTALVIYSGAFKINTHQIKSENCGGEDKRIVTGSMRAAQIIENTRTDIYGSSIGLTPSMTVSTDAGVTSTIFTQKIANEVNNVTCKNFDCTVKTDRKNVVATSASNSNKSVINYYILQVISHEVGHSSRLAASPPTLPSSYYHYDGSGTVMDPAVTFKSGKNGGTYTMPNQFNMAEDPQKLTIYSGQ